MADDEEGFTFVDKRRAQADDAPHSENAAAGTAPNAADTVFEATPLPSEMDADEDDGATASIYSVLGYCVSLLAAEAWQKLGLLADPQTGQAQPDLAQAKVAIDAVGDLAARMQTAPPEEVPDSLQRDLRTLLNDLRLNYVSRQGQPS